MVGSRRAFLYLAGLQALWLQAPSGFAAPMDTAIGGQKQDGGARSFYSLPAGDIENAVERLKGKRGSQSLVAGKGLPLMQIVSEQAATGREYEFHEWTEHIFEVLEGKTRFDVGGKPENPRKTKAGEWLAPASTGSSVVEMSKGDRLVIPRGVPHKRTTDGEVVLLLISITNSGR